MASIKEIRSRMSGVRETKQITGAMYLIASTKLRHARESLEHTRPFFDAIRSEIVRILRADEGEVSRYFYDADGAEPDGGVCGIVAITADKGLAGAYNMNVIREAEALMKRKSGARLFVIGEYGRRYFQSHRAPMETGFQYSAESPTLERARDICTDLLEKYEDTELSEILVVYTDMKSSLSSTVRTQRLLPLERGHFQAAAQEQNPGPAAEFEFVPSKMEVLRVVIRSYISGFLYSAMVDSFCAEQNARVTAMDAAGRNAEELLNSLALQLNRERQSAITQEITEVSAGARAQRQGQRKEAQAEWQARA